MRNMLFKVKWVHALVDWNDITEDKDNLKSQNG